MEETTLIQYCEPPPSDVIPMLVVALGFIAAAILFRLIRNRRSSRHRK